MNHCQLELVRSSYERVRVVRSLFADLFRRRLLLLAPELSDRMEREVGTTGARDDAFLDLVSAVVQGLDRLDVLLPTLAALARRLHRRGASDADYEVVGEALAWTVEQVLAGAPEAVVAWSETFTLLAGVMRRAAGDAPVVPAPPPPRAALRTLSDWPPS